MSVRRAADERIEGTPDGLNAISEIMDVPDTPTIGTPTAGLTSVSVPVTAATTGGTPTSFSVTSNPGSIVGTSATSPVTVTGLTGGTAYTFTARAINSNGTSAASVASSSVTPADFDSGYDALASVTLSTTASSITFSGIPTGYKHLQIRSTMFGSTTGVDAPYIRFNGDSGSNYTFHSLVGLGGTATPVRAQAATSQTSINVGGFWNGLLGSTIPVLSIVDILDYANLFKNKTVRTLGGMDDNGTYSTVALASGVWMNTSAITSMTIFLSGSTTFTANSSFALYGVK